MKNELKISTVSIVCVLCASVVSGGAYGASSVRALGGAGTYTSAASASKSGASTGVARAGSVRISPTTVKANAAKPSGGASVTAGRVATSPRLSLGKYLGGKVSVSGGSSTRPNPGTPSGGGSTIDPGLATELNNRVNVLEDDVADLKTSSEDLLANKQDKLTGDDYIEIDDNGNVSLIVDNLKQDLTGIDGADGREVSIATSADGKYIVWQYAGDTTWQQLIAIEDLVGPQGEKGEKGDPGEAANLDLYSTTAQMNQAIADAVKGYVKSDTLSTMLAEFPTNEEVATTYATKEELAGVATGAGDALKDYAKKTDIADVERTGNMTQTIAGADTASASKYTSEKAVADALATKADASAVTTLSETVTNVSNVTNNFDTRMTELTTTVENNMQTLKTELQTELAGVSQTVNNITNEEGQVVNIAPNSITAVELADNSVTNVKLATGAVTKDRLADEVKNELVGKAEGDNPDGMYVLLVTPNGERVWADLTADPAAAGETSGGATN